MAIEHQNREHPKHGSKGHTETFHTSRHKAEHVVLPTADTSPSNQNQSGNGPPQENKRAAQYHEQPAEEHRRVLAAMTKLFRDQDKEQPDDQVNDGKTSKQRRYSTHDVMKNGQELEVFIIEYLLTV